MNQNHTVHSLSSPTGPLTGHLSGAGALLPYAGELRRRAPRPASRPVAGSDLLQPNTLQATNLNHCAADSLGVHPNK